MAILFRFGNGNGDVAAVFNYQPKRFEFGLKPGNSDGRWSHIDTTPRLSKIKRDTDDTNFARRNLGRRAVRARRKLFATSRHRMYPVAAGLGTGLAFTRHGKSRL